MTPRIPECTIVWWCLVNGSSQPGEYPYKIQSIPKWVVEGNVKCVDGWAREFDRLMNCGNSSLEHKISIFGWSFHISRYLHSFIVSIHSICLADQICSAHSTSCGRMKIQRKAKIYFHVLFIGCAHSISICVTSEQIYRITSRSSITVRTHIAHTHWLCGCPSLFVYVQFI